MYKPTDEQAEIIKSAAQPKSLMISAYAGCAKTSSLEMASQSIREPTLALAFNKKIADELGPRLPENFQCRTLNAMGHRVWARTIANPIKLDDRKLGKLITAVAKEWKINLPPHDWEGLLATINRAQSMGIVPIHYNNVSLLDSNVGTTFDTDEAWNLAADLAGFESPNIDLCREILHRNNQLSLQGTISFSDQIYAPTCLGGKFPQYPRLMVDEAQDLSPLNHLMIQLCTNDNSNIIAVGDPKQAIYQFRGADAQSMESLRQLRTLWIDLPLTLTFRCPKSIVSRQQSHAPGFRAYETNKVGKLYHFPYPSVETWNWHDVEEIINKNTCQSIAILCRNNAPLMSLAFKLLRRGIAIEVAGRDIGKGLIALTKKLCPDDNTPISHLLSKIKSWEHLEALKATSQNNDFKLELLEDKAESIYAVAQSTECRTAGELRRLLRQLFESKSSKIFLSSIHRAKGLEWDCVLHLDPWRIPSLRATSELQLEQEYNLQYVAETRTRNVLILANLRDFQ